MVFLLFMWMIVFMKVKEVILGLMVQNLGVGIKISVTFSFTMMEKVLMLMGEVDLGLRPSSLPPIIQVYFVDHWVLIAMVMIEVDIGLRPANFLHITMVDYTLPTQGFLNNLFKGVFKEKIHIIIYLLFLSKHTTTLSFKHVTTS